MIEGRAPTGEPALLGGKVPGLVGNVIDVTHEGVERGESVALGFGQQEEGVIEVAVRGAGNAMAVLVGVGNRPSGLRFSKLLFRAGDQPFGCLIRCRGARFDQMLEQRATKKPSLLELWSVS